MNTAAKRSSGLSCPAARLPAAPSSSKGPCNLGRPLLVAASGGGGGSGGSGGSALLRRRQAWEGRRSKASTGPLWRGPAAGSGADGPPASNGQADSVGSSEVGVSPRNGNGSSGGGSSDGSPAAGSSAGNGRGGRRREPCLPPLPFWVAGVSVVGLPDDQLVFSFLTPSETAAAARRQLRPEAPYGPSALKLATLQGDRVQAVLDRWQYAIAQRELASFDARPMLWWRYESALKSAAGGGSGYGSGEDDSSRGSAGGRGSTRASLDEEPAAADPQESVFNRRQMRRMARAAKAAAKAAGRRQSAAAASSWAGSDSSSDVSRQDSDRCGSSAAQHAPAGLAIDQAAFQPSWQVCTLRGLPDGTVIYKFADDFEPVVAGPELGTAAASVAAGAAGAAGAAADAAEAEAAVAAGTAAAGAAAAGAAAGAAAAATDDAGGVPVAGFTPQSPPGGEVGAWWRQEQRPELGRLLLVQEQQRSVEGVPWSSALRLGVRFSSHAKSVLNKLQIFTTEYEQQQGSSVMLSSRLHPSYEKALARVKRALEEEQQPQQEAAQQQLEAAQQQQQQQQQQREQAQRAQRGRERQQQEARRSRWGLQNERALQSPAEQQQEQQEEEQASQTQQQEQQAQQEVQHEPQQMQRRQQQEQAQQDATDSGGLAALLAEQPFRRRAQQREPGAEEQQEQQPADRAALPGAEQLQPQQQEEVEWQAELLPRPQWQPPAAEQPGVQPSKGEAVDRGQRATALAASNTAQQQAKQQQQKQVQQAAAPWAQLLALAAALGAAALRLLRSIVTGLASFWLALYRRLPVFIRRLFWRSWPPQWPGHLSPSVRQLLLARRMGAAELQAAGFNADGHSVDPLADLQAWHVERLTGCQVRDLSLFRAALTHKSALPQELRVTRSYERLEFLGDAVLSLACRTLLMERCPTSDEGEMTKLGSLLVSGASNARYAAFLGLEHYLVLDPRTLREGGQHTPHILADVFEALLGALYLDAGWAAAHAFCRRVLGACVDWGQVEADAEDWKGVLSRVAYQQRRPQPRYRTTSTRKRQFRGGLQLKWYTVEVQYCGEVVGTGSGWERRWAEQAAARQALDNMGQLPGQEVPGDVALEGQ